MPSRPRALVVPPDPMDVCCPACGEMNFYISADRPPVINVRFEDDERGPHYFCETCAAMCSVQEAVMG